jgi:hypothetical protein
MTPEIRHPWWSELRQSGMIISPAVLNEFLPEAIGPIEYYRNERLRNAFTAFASWSQQVHGDDKTGLYKWIDAVLEDFLGYENRVWQKHSSISEVFKVSASRRGGPALKPSRVLLNDGDVKQPRLLVSIDSTSKRIGMGRGRNEYSSFLELLRGTSVPLGILTNGWQIRLVFTGTDYDCWVEWDVERWFEDALGKDQLAGLFHLCGIFGTVPRKEDAFPLLSAIQNSRTRQGELSQVLGEQTRRAVEKLLKEIDKSVQNAPDLQTILANDPHSSAPLSEEEQNNALYQATIRLMMRMVVSLFAEARGLLPTDNEVYYYSYGIEGLFSQLQNAKNTDGVQALEEQHQAWIRLLSLFRLTYDGSDLQDVPIPAYGGGLFRRGDPKSSDPVLRALAIYEDERVKISDAVVLELLSLLKIGKVRTRVGRSAKMVSGAVDFSDLRTEYIGMMYEGLLDYQLRKVRPDEEAVVILNLGVQPALPFSLLKSMSDQSLKDLIQKLGKEKVEKKVEGEEEGESDEEEASPETDLAEETPSEEIGDETESVIEVESSDISAKIYEWAEKVVELTGMVKRPRGKTANEFQYKKDVQKRAKGIIGEIVGPNEMYLIRGSGTRKGTGTFYTKPQLAVPTVHRTLEPLVYDVEGDGEKRKLTPKTPEIILSLKVCDPAMGSGSFLVAALRYLSDALYESLWYHKKIKARGSDSTVITLPTGTVAEGTASEDLLRCTIDSERFEPMVKARLKRYLVERCIYGVDLNPLAVELGKLALWVETMDRELPFEFLDHKLKVGNSLVGCWFDNFTEYPVMAWLREGGDKGHKGVHFESGAWTNAIKKILDDKVKPELVRIIQGQKSIDWTYSNEDAVKLIFDKAVRRFERLHGLSIYGDSFDERETFFRDCIVNDPDILQLKERFDLWCAIWFWHGDWIDYDVPTPEKFYSPTPGILERTRQLVTDLKFFHWELEFADVFVAGKGGFDAVVGNPPWEISKPKSQEFFTRYDPIYRMRGKQEALTEQKNLFIKDTDIERSWLIYSAYFKAMSNWNKNVAFPFGDPTNEQEGGTALSLGKPKSNKEVHFAWRKYREKHVGFADSAHPFRYQGSADINTYKMFLEIAHGICRSQGRFGLIVPSGIYTDEGTTSLRELFLSSCFWEWLFGFENRKKIFDIDTRLKFCSIILMKGDNTSVILASFMHQNLSEWEKPHQFVLPYSNKQIHKFCPKSQAILEVRNLHELNILEKIFNKSTLFGDLRSLREKLDFAREFDMTNNSNLFPNRSWWEERGYTNDDYGRGVTKEQPKPELFYRGAHIGQSGELALPLFEGKMIWQFDYRFSGYVKGTNQYSEWINLEEPHKRVESQYLIAKSIVAQNKPLSTNYRFGFRAIQNATNQRTLIVTLLPFFPTGHSLFTINSKNLLKSMHLLAIFNSFPIDRILRLKMSQNNVSLFYIDELPLPKADESIETVLKKFVLQLSANGIHFAPIWIVESLNRAENWNCRHWKSLWAITPYERLRLRSNIDAIVAELYGLTYDDFAWILRDCASPKEDIRQLAKNFDSKGFWRVDKTEDPELRHTVLALKAFADLKAMGIDAFCALNDGEGWMIPESLTYASNPDGTIVFDTLEGRTVPVRERLGPRYLDWQLTGTPEESWKECEMHARNILGDEEFERIMTELEAREEIRHDKEKIGVEERVIDDESGSVLGVAEVLKKAGNKKEEIEKKEKNQMTLGEW